MKAAPVPVRNGTILVFAGGGLGHVAGGVGSLMRYLIEAWANDPDPPSLRVVDTRGSGGAADAALHFLGAALMLPRLACTASLALVHAHMTTRGSVLRKTLLCALASAFQAPFIIHMHGADFFAYYERLPKPGRIVVATIVRRARRVVVVGQIWQDFLVERVAVKRDRIAIVTNGVPGPARPAPQRPPTAPVHVLFLGRLGDRKGVPELIEALASPALRRRAWKATVAGDGDIARFRALAARSGLAERVVLPGWVEPDQTPSLLESADLLVLPSHDEAMPIAIIEALARKIPVIATPVGAIPEFLRDGVEARLVPPGDPARLTEAIAELIDDPQARRSLAEAGHAVFRARLDIRITAERLRAIYQEAMRPPSPPFGGLLRPSAAKLQ